MDVVTGQF
jgi:hypothetical protein